MSLVFDPDSAPLLSERGRALGDDVAEVDRVDGVGLVDSDCWTGDLLRELALPSLFTFESLPSLLGFDFPESLLDFDSSR